MSELDRLLKGRKYISVDELANILNVTRDYILSKIEELERLKLVKKFSKEFDYIYPGFKLKELGSLPEEKIFNILKSYPGNEVPLSELRNKLTELDEDDFKAGLSILYNSKIIDFKKIDKTVYIKILRRELDQETNFKFQFVKEVLDKEGLKIADLDIAKKKLLDQLLKRPGFFKIRRIKDIYIEITGDYSKIIEYLESKWITSLSPTIIKKRLWIGRKFKPYDLNAEVYRVYPGRAHPMHELIKEVREIFLALGFREATGPLIELSFINFDMLFQPQDHPARDMQDTFYIKEPSYGVIPYPELIEPIKKTHENGWITGSKGWGYTWSLNEAKKLVLRTHTTAVTVRALYETGEKPDKIFCIGSVFRNETVDYKHLVEFMQVDGIVIHPNANLRWLLGIIEYFYKRMGYNKVKFWPSYFPYTEPSLQPSIYVDKIGKWLELGGAGIFRPEVTLPLGVKWPVLAWGLGLERLLMLKYDLNDIRVIYKNDLGWLRKLSVEKGV